MSLLDKVKENKKRSVAVKATIELSEEDAKIYNELKTLIDEKDLLTVALDNPKNLERRLEAGRKEKVAVNKKIELTMVQKDGLDALKKSGYTMAEILGAAYENLNLKKSLGEIKSDMGSDTKETVGEKQ